jgi:hypothetical protein
MVIVHAENSRNTPLVRAMNEIRTWLDRERIEPMGFRTVASGAGLGFQISFRKAHEAQRFQARFASLLT